MNRSHPREAPRGSSVADLFRAASSLAWGLTALAVRELGPVLLPDTAGARLNAGNIPSDQIQQLVAAMLRPVLSADGNVSRSLMRMAIELALESGAFLQSLSSDPESRHAWQEFQNKLQAYYLFEHADSILGISSDASVTLPEAVHHAGKLDPHIAVWAIEGLGHSYTKLRLKQQALPDGLLQKGAAVELPTTAMVPLHSGMGLALAEFLVPRETCGDLVEAFTNACRNNSAPGYVEVAYESLGLVVRNLYPHLLGPVDACLSRTHRDIYPFFWHGVGRGIYFSPLRFLPDRNALWNGVAECIGDPPNRVAKRNALAGYAWALTLVNLRHPEILALVLGQGASHFPEADAFMNGVYSSMIVWRDCAPSDPHLESLISLPGTCRPELWERFFTQPCLRARRDYPAKSAQKQIGSVFRL